MIPAILAAVSTEFRVPVPDLLGTRRRKAEAEARQAAMFLARELTGFPIQKIGRKFRRHHATVLHAIVRTMERARGTEFGERLDRVRLAVIAPSLSEPEA